MTMPQPLDCAEAAALLYELIDNELTEDLQRAVNKHLKDCAHCFAFHEFEQAFNKFVEKSGGAPTTPADLRRRILEDLNNE